MSKNLNSELKKEKSYTCDPSKCGVEGSPGALGREPYGEEAYKLHKLNLCETLMCNIGVTKNNEVTLPKPRTKDTKELA
jgi:hypothetical protein